MKTEFLKYLWCPQCHADLVCHASVAGQEDVREGSLQCRACNKSWPVVNGIPRFVEHRSYAASFGSQWNTFAKSQIDRQGYNESQVRFDSEIGWSEDQLRGRSVVEVGSGAGRFVDIVSQRKAAMVIGLDITDAVDAASRNISRENVQFVQGDIFESPIRTASVDAAYSIGVLHHTPDPQAAFDRMTALVKDNGLVAVSLYETSYYHRPNRNTLGVVTRDLLWSLNTFRCELFRSVTTRVPYGMMIAYCKTVIPVLHFLNKIPLIRYVRYLVPSTCYRNLPFICSMVDTMDTYSTRIVHQYRGKDVFQWFRKLGLKEVTLMNSRAGWVSVTGEKGTEAERLSRRVIARQPRAPGQGGFIE